MKKIGLFLMVGFAFAALHLSTVSAQTGMPPMGMNSGMPPMGNQGMPPTGMNSGMPPMGNQGMPPMGMNSGMPPMGNQGMPPMGNTTGMPPMGNHMSNLGDHCGEIQAKNEKKRMRKEAKCLRRALNDHKPTAKIHDKPKDGLGAYGCGKKKTGSKAGQIACLRGLLDGPSGATSMQGEHHDGPRDLMANKGPRRGGKMGNYGCGNKNRKKHVNCLRDLLDTTPLSAQVKHAKKGKKRGFYGCNGLRDGKWKKHVNCLRRLLDQHGPELAQGGAGKRGMAPGTR